MRPCSPLTALVSHFAYGARKEAATWNPSKGYPRPGWGRAHMSVRASLEVVERWVVENKEKDVGARHDKGVDLALILLRYATLGCPQ
jgi:hypothetical protein